MAEPGQRRKLEAILSADVVGYSRLMQDDDAATVETLTKYRTIFSDFVSRHEGRIVDSPGDNILVEFDSPVEAVQCAVEIQSELSRHNLQLADHRQMRFRIGINLGDILSRDDGTIYGDGVNIAARLEALAEPGGITVSGTVFDHAENKLPVAFEFTGEQKVKNIGKPVRVYRVRGEAGDERKSVRNAVPWRKRSGIIAVAAIVVVAAGIVVIFDWQMIQTPESDTSANLPVAGLDTRRLAVLPFTNVSSDPESEYFSDGMTEELIAKLSQLHSLTVIARTSVMQYKGTVKGIAEIGNELSVGSILEGSVRKSGDRLRITAQLIDVASQGHLWTETYDRPYADVFAVQSDVAQQVARALRVALHKDAVERLDIPGTDDLEAYDLYLQGLFHWNQMTGEGLEAGKALFERAIERDPSFAKAHTGLAQAYEILGEFGYLPATQAFPKAQAAAETALALDDSIAEAHSQLAVSSTFLQFDWQAAERGHRRALEINPNSPYAHDSYGMLYLTGHGEHDVAIAHLRRAIELDPLAVLYHADLAFTFYYARRWDEAIVQFRKVLKMEPAFANAHRGIGLSYAEMGRLEPAIEAFRKAVEHSGGSSSQLSALGWAYGLAGRRREALGVLDRLRVMAKQNVVDAQDVAMVHLGLGDKDKALEWLEKAYEEGAGSWRLVFLNVYPPYDPLRSDPRFAELVRKIGLGD